MADISETLRAGVEHHWAGRLQEAEDMYRRVLQIHPRHAGAIHLLGLVAFQMGKHDMAVELLNAAIGIDAFHAPIPADLGEIYRATGKIPEAIAAYQKSLDLDPEVAEAQNNLGTLYETAGNLVDATACFREAVRLKPGFGEAHANLGSALVAQGEYDEARPVFEQALALSPDNVRAHFGLGKCRIVAGDWRGALERFQMVARLQPELAEANYHGALARLALGEFVEGWRDFEWRLRCPTLACRSFPLPSWNGAALHGHRVLVHAEGALSDTIQFIRFVPTLSERGGTAILDVPRALAPLLAESGFENLVRDGEPTPECHLQVPLLSLPKVLGTTLETIPAGSAYLSARPRLVAEWGQKLSELSGFKVGIAWQGNPSDGMDRFRSIPLVEFQPLAEVPGARLVSLQKKDGLEQLAAAADRFEVVQFSDVLDEAEGPFMDTAAIMANLDLVIACDTAVAHLAGALGVPVWVALPTGASWRWMQDRGDSPWYPTMRLFRQGMGAPWADVFAQMAGELAAQVAARAAGST